MSLVSVIIPYYKKRQYIDRSIKSVLNQKYKKFEIIIVYDDQLINDLLYLKEIKKKDSRIRIIINKKNIGAGLSRNKAIKIAKGKYIAFIDADDLWNSNKLFEQLKFMKKNKYSISHTSYNIIDKNNNIIGSRTAKNLSYSDLLKSCDVGLSTVIIKKNLLKNNRFANLKTKEDYVLWLKLSKYNNFYAMKQKFTSWRSLSDSLSSSVFQRFVDGYRVYKFYLKQSYFKSFLSLFVLSINFLKK
jgi:teichuronic acid biosynthesis glycosyltransferase TuaG